MSALVRSWSGRDRRRYYKEHMENITIVYKCEQRNKRQMGTRI